jgi:hypothetical protein
MCERSIFAASNPEMVVGKTKEVPLEGAGTSRAPPYSTARAASVNSGAIHRRVAALFAGAARTGENNLKICRDSVRLLSPSQRLL